MRIIKYFPRAVLAASLLLGCAGFTGCAKAPDNIFSDTEMSDGAQSAAAGTSAPANNVLLTPTAEALKNARSEIEEIRAADGIFKLDDARIILPEGDEMPVYDARSLVTSYAQDAEQAERTAAAFGFEPDDMRYSLVCEERTILTKEEYAAQSGYFAIFEPRSGSRELVYHISCTNYMSREFYDGNYAGNTEIENGASAMNAEEVIDLTDADAETLSREIDLIGGKTTVGDIIRVVGEKREGLPYDEKLTLRPVLLLLFRQENGGYAAAADVRAFIDGACFSDSSPARFSGAAFGLDEPFAINLRCGAVLIRPGFADCRKYMGTNIGFEKRGGEKYDAVISAETLFRLLGETFSGGTVYDVREVSLGYLTLVGENDKHAYFDRGSARVLPVWQVRFNTANMAYFVTVNAVTGELSARTSNSGEIFP